MKIIERVPAGAVAYEAPKIKDIQEFLEGRVAGQKEATDQVARTLAQALSGVRVQKNGPRGSVLMMGPSGVGKTETVMAAVEFLLSRSTIPTSEWDPEHFMIKVDCGNYTLEHQISSLIGSPPGYKGSKTTKNGGDHSDSIAPSLDDDALKAKRIPLKDGTSITVVLLDEIEKAHLNVRNFLLAALDRGRTKNAVNEEIDFRNTLFFFTSNLGNKASTKRRVGLVKTNAGSEEADMRRAALLEEFRAEDVSRMAGRPEGALVYKPLDRSVSRKILHIQLEQIEKQFAEAGIHVSLQITEHAAEKLLDLGVNPVTGARALKNVLQELIAQPLLHPSKIDTIRALHKNSVYIDYSGDFRFYAAAPALAEETISQERGVKDVKGKDLEEVEKRDKQGIWIDITPEAEALMKKLDVSFNRKTYEITMQRAAKIAALNATFGLEPLIKNSPRKRVKIIRSGTCLHIFVQHENPFIIDENGLPFNLGFNLKNQSFSWHTSKI